MRFLFLSILASFAVASAAFSQTIDVKPSKGGALPTYRPALIGNGPTAIINRIDAAGLVQKGQKDALVMFTCTVQKTGDVVWSATYRGTPDSKLLEQEVLDKLGDAKFIPAVYNHTPVDAIFYGTVTFAVIEGKPRLRIFSNQEAEELKNESDFVGPQPFFGNESKFNGWHYPPKNESPLEINGAVELGLDVTDKGFVNKLTIVNEEPPFVGFGDAAAHDLGKARFIPAFRNGQPVACKVTLPVYFKHRDEVFNARLNPN
jgi:Gram-negative bacterial TonB protein C-terminal